MVEKQLPCEPCVQNVITRRALRTRDPLLYILHNFILFNSLDQSYCVCLNQNMDKSELSFLQWHGIKLSSGLSQNMDKPELSLLP